MKIKVKEMHLGDVVNLGSPTGDYYMTATVHAISDGMVTLWRPYIQTSEFAYTGGVILTIGLEIVRLSLESNQDIELLIHGSFDLRCPVVQDPDLCRPAP